jgi:hypothetical protein
MRSCYLALGLTVVLLAGCQADKTKPYPVHGKVVLENGQPATELAGGMVTFNSKEMKTSSIGEIGADGTFELTTLQQGDGVIPGTYEVAVSPPTTDEENTDRKRKKIQSVPQYVCLQSSITVEPKRSKVQLTVREATPPKRK